MKKYLALLFVLLVGSGQAEIRFPSSSFEVSALSEAKEAAAKKKQPIAFVYTDKNTTCSLCQGATASILQEFRTSAVIVYVKDLKGAPRNVAKVLSSKGKYIPKVALFDADLSKDFGLVTYEQISTEGDRPLRDLKKAARPNAG